MLRYLNRVFKTISFIAFKRMSGVYCNLYFRMNGIYTDGFTVIGVPLLDIHKSGTCEIGSGLVMVSKDKYATLGKNNKCKLVVGEGARLKIGNQVGMSNASIVATLSIEIGNNVMIGGGVTIVDSDFHSLNPRHWHSDDDLKHMRKAPVIIGDNVFIGMNAIILKGVKVGHGAIIAAGSVIIRDIPGGEIWGGNPAQFIKVNQYSEAQ